MKIKKLLVILLAIAVLASTAVIFTACGPKTSPTYTIALITDKGDIDDKSFNQGAWEGVVEYAEANNISHKYYKPQEATNEKYLEAIDLAVAGGAKIIVTPGFLFEVPVYLAQTKYPNVKFVLLDGDPHSAGSDTVDAVYKTEKNAVGVHYAEEEAGFLAGYAAVKDGYRKLGFMGGMAVPAVQAFGYGYLQGAEQAAVELALADDAVTVKYHYTGDFAETDTNKTTAATMFTGGTEVIFACGGSVGKSVMSAASEAGKKVIGVDVDQKEDSATVITSATKGLGASVKLILDAFFNEGWATYGGESYYFDATNNGIGLPNDFTRFTTFNKAAYDAVYAKIVDDTFDPIRTINDTNANKTVDEAEILAQLTLNKVDLKLVA